LLDLISEYQASWSGRCRGRARTAYSEGPEGIAVRADFMRWIYRRMARGNEMVLKQQIESDHLMILIFRKDDRDKSMVRYVAETILELGEDPAGVPTEALHYCVPGHPFSSMQRLRELCAAYRRQWPGFMETDPIVDSHKFKGNRYYFSKQFLAWLRASLPEIEKVVYPVTIKRKIPIDK